MGQILLPIVDVETSGLSPHDSYLLEIAVLLVDVNLNEIARFEQTIHYPAPVIADMYETADPFVQDMHTQNGLWDEIAKPGPGLDDVDVLLSYWLQNQIDIFRSMGHQDEDIELRTIGNSLRLDLNFIEAELPDTYKALGYRSIDMSAVEKFMALFAPGYSTYVKQPSASHRAMADNEMCLEQARSVAQHVATLHAENEDLKKQNTRMAWAEQERMKM